MEKQVEQQVEKQAKAKERVMASVEIITAINPIPKADSICQYKVQGWYIVDRIGSHNVGDRVIFVAIDSWVPKELAPFLSKNGNFKEYKGIEGSKVRTVKLRGALSQGLLLKISGINDEKVRAQIENSPIGQDISDLLKIQKWEDPIALGIAGDAKGNFPSFLSKTDEIRIQSIDLDDYRNYTYYITEKLDGSSATYYSFEGNFGVCSRNLELKETDGNVYWYIAKKYEIAKNLPEGYAIQGEIIGPKIQGNRYKLDEPDLYIFNVIKIGEGRVSLSESIKICNDMGIKFVPIIDSAYEIFANVDTDTILLKAEGRSTLFNTEREGIVFRTICGTHSFKAISNKFLLKEKE
jgi:RNA ligase (TIGR02306 family)